MQQLAKPFVLLTAVVAAVAASARKRRVQTDADTLWHEATTDGPAAS